MSGNWYGRVQASWLFPDDVKSIWGQARVVDLGEGNDDPGAAGYGGAALDLSSDGRLPVTRRMPPSWRRPWCSSLLVGVIASM